MRTAAKLHRIEGDGSHRERLYDGGADFRGILIADHVPAMVGGRKTGWAYSIGYIKALYDMARDAKRRA
jgi:hypothetical protein